MSKKLGVNIDHVATLRQARGTKYPDPVTAAAIVENAGADQITIHLREDRRHIQDIDVRLLKKTCQTELNLEMAATEAMFAFAQDLLPHSITLVPEKRQELTTEGGLDIIKNRKKLVQAIPEMIKKGVRVSLFIDPDLWQVEMAAELKADAIEIHTGSYADAKKPEDIDKELERIRQAAKRGHELGLWVAAGHGLHYQNTVQVAAIPEIVEFNIGHSIIARAIFVGLDQAVREMKKILEG